MNDACHEDDRRLSFLEDRYSVKEFSPAALTCSDYAALKRSVIAPASSLYARLPPLRAFSVPARVDGLTDFAIEVTSSDQAWTVHAPIDRARIADELVAACQGQSLLRNAACLFVIGVDEAELASNPYERHRQAVFRSGLLTGAMYRAATQLQIGTTTIGGFSDKAVLAILRATGWFPIVAQAFGVPAMARRKVDMARIVLGNGI